MLEKHLQTKIKRSFDLYCNNKKIHCMYQKIPDTGYTKNKFDCWVLHEGKYTAIELKMNRTKKAFNFKNMFSNRVHELLNLKRVIDCGHNAWVIIGHQPVKGKSVTVYAVECSIVFMFHKRGTVFLDDILEHGIELKKIRNDFRNEWVYDLTPILNGLEKTISKKCSNGKG